MLTIRNRQYIMLNGRKATQFSVYELRNGGWVHDYTTTVDGSWVFEKTIARKHCEANGKKFSPSDWSF